MLTLTNVSYSYLGKGVRLDAIRNVTYSFQEATFYVVMGPSGSGKSTLLHIIDALDKPTTGQIICDEKDIGKIPSDQYRREIVSMVYQNFCLLPFMTVYENVCFPAKLIKGRHNQVRDIAIQKLIRVGIDKSYFNRMPHTLSGGEQQRVAIARALCAGGKIILADEPTGNLDSKNAENIAELFAALAHEEKKIVILVTHDLAVSKKADVVLSIRDGELITTQPEQSILSVSTNKPNEVSDQEITIPFAL